jgi:hypothetical protein
VQDWEFLLRGSGITDDDAPAPGGSEAGDAKQSSITLDVSGRAPPSLDVTDSEDEFDSVEVPAFSTEKQGSPNPVSRGANSVFSQQPSKSSHLISQDEIITQVNSVTPLPFLQMDAARIAQLRQQLLMEQSSTREFSESLWQQLTPSELFAVPSPELYEGIDVSIADLPFSRELNEALIAAYHKELGAGSSEKEKE